MREARRMGMGAPKEDRRGRFTLHRTPGEDMTWQIGDVTVTRVEEHVMELPTRYLVPGLTADLVAAAGDWAAEYGEVGLVASDIAGALPVVLGGRELG